MPKWALAFLAILVGLPGIAGAVAFTYPHTIGNETTIERAFFDDNYNAVLTWANSLDNDGDGVPDSIPIVPLATGVSGILPDANVADDITVSNYLPLVGGTLSGPTTTDDLEVEGRLDFGTRETFTNADGTPDVSNGSYFITGTTASTITDFDGTGIESGDVIVVYSNAAITYDCTSSGLTCGTTDGVTAAGDVTVWQYDGADWNLISFIDQSDDVFTDGGGGGGVTDGDKGDVTVSGGGGVWTVDREASLRPTEALTSSSQAPTANAFGALAEWDYVYDETLVSPNNGAILRFDGHFGDGGVKASGTCSVTTATRCNVDSDCPGVETCTGPTEKSKHQYFRLRPHQSGQGELQTLFMESIASGDSDPTSVFSNLQCLGPNGSAADEGCQNMRLSVTDFDVVPDGTLSAAITALDTTASLSGLSGDEEEIRAVGVHRLIVYTDPPCTGCTEVSVSSESSGVWSLGTGEGTGRVGQCIAHKDSIVTTDDSVTTYVWLPIIAVTADTVTTEYIAQGLDRGAPDQYPTSSGTNNAFVAECDEITSFDPNDPTSVGIKDVVTNGGADAGIPISTAWHIPYYPPFSVYGIALIMENKVPNGGVWNGMRIVARKASSTESHKLNRGLWIFGSGTGRDTGSGEVGWEEALRVQNSLTGLFFQTIPSESLATQRPIEVDFQDADFSGGDIDVIHIVDDATQSLTFNESEGWGEGGVEFLMQSGGTLSGELVADDLGIEFIPGDTITNCSTFSATGGGIFYDDSEGIFKKCQDNVLTDLDTGGGSGATTDAGAVTHVTSATDDFAIGGTDSSSAFFFDESAGDLTINVAGGSIDIQADAADGQALILKEGADDGTNTFTLSVPASGLTATSDCELDADGSIPDTCLSGVLALSGGTLTGEAVVDDLGLEFTPGDTLADCSTFAATGGGIFYDDSEGVLKKCQDNVLSDLDTTAAGSGDALEVEDGDNAGTFTGADTTARLEDQGDINFVHADGGAGGPDAITGEIRANTVDEAELAATFSICETIYAPTENIAATDDIPSLWRAPAAVTLTEVWCETDQTITLDLQIDDGTPADVMGADLSCGTGTADNTGLTGGMADGDRLDLLIATATGSPTRLNVCWEYTYD